jgi:PAS domain S-box-containing protein
VYTPTTAKPEPAAPARIPVRTKTLRIALWYVQLSAVWIFLSGWLLHHFVHDPAWAAWLENVKGWAFVLVTGGLLYLFTERHIRRLDRESGRREQAEAARQADGETLRRQAEQLRLVTEASADGLWDWNLATNVAEISPRYWEIIGYQPGEVVTDLAFLERLVHPEDWPALRQGINDHIAGHSAQWIAEYRILAKDGSVKWLWGRGRVMERAPDGRPARMTGAVSDITARKQIEARLRESEERYRRLFEAEKDAVLLVDCETRRFVDANASAQKLYGYSDAEFLGLAIADISAEPEKSRLSVTKEETEVPLRWHRKRDGTVFPVEISGSYFTHSGRRVHVAAIRDITERHWAEAILRRSAFANERLLACMTEIDACPDLDSALLCLLRKSIELGGVTAGGVYLIEDREAVLRHAEGVPAEFIERVRRRPVDTGYVKAALDQPHQIVNIAAQFPEHRQGVEAFGLRHVYCVALTAGEKPFGYLNLASRTTEPPNVADIELVRVLTLQTKALFMRLATEDRLRAILTAMTEGVVAHAADGSIIECNQRAEAILGLSRDQILGRKPADPVWQTFHENGQPFPAAEHPAAVCLRTGQPCRDVTMGLQRADGTRRWISINAEPVFKGDQPRPVSAVASFTDITERRQTEEKIHKLSLAVEQSPASVVITNLWGEIEYVNPSFCEITGYSARELLGQNPRLLKSGLTPPETYAQLWQAVALGTTWDGELLNRKKDGTLFWEHAIISPIRTPGGQTTHYLGIKEDITARKAAEAELRASREQLRVLGGRLETVREEERTRLAREIHDVLAQDLTRLKIDTVWLSRRLSQPLDPARQKLYIDKLAGMVRVTDDAIRSVQKIAAELRPVVLDTLGLSAAVEWQARDFQEHTGIACVASISGAEFVPDRERSTAMFRILQESLTNVIRHAAATQVDIRLHYAAGRVTLAVQDNGRGIPPAKLADLHSLGLLGMRERATLLGGQLEITGGPGRGTVVHLALPAPPTPEPRHG